MQERRPDNLVRYMRAMGRKVGGVTDIVLKVFPSKEQVKTMV